MGIIDMGFYRLDAFFPLPTQEYQRTDPNVEKSQASSFLGLPVTSNGRNVALIYVCRLPVPLPFMLINTFLC